MTGLKARFLIKGQTKRTKAKLFKDVQDGDVIKVVMPLKNTGHGRTTYVPYLAVTNERTNQSETYSLNALGNVLECFVTQELG